MTLLEINYVPLSTVKQWDRNPKEHDIGSLAKSIMKYGFQDPPKYDAALGGIATGNGRIETLHKLWEQDPRAIPRGIGVDPDGNWLVPVVFGNDLPSRQMAEAYAIDHNNLTVMGGHGITTFDMAKMWDMEQYLSLLAETIDDVVSVTPAELELLMRVQSEIEEEVERPFAAISSKASAPSLVFGKFKILISQEELEDLEQFATTYESENGGFIGFVQALIS